MDTVREWAAAICSAAVLCAAVGMISPDGRQAKTLRVVLSVVMLCLLVSPVSQIRNCSESVEEYIAQPVETESGLMELIGRQTAEAMERSVIALAEEQLSEMGIEAQEISVVMDISADGCITIGQVVITVDGQYSPEKITDRLYNRLGLNAEVVQAEG